MINRFMRLLATSGLVVAAFASEQGSARAGMVTFTASTGGSALAGQNYATFDNRTLGSTPQAAASYSISFTGGGAVVNGSSPAQYSAPIFSGSNNQYFYPNANTATPPANGADTTNYISTGAGSATVAFANGSDNYLGILWGSIDSYNSLTFNFLDGTTQTVTGSQILAALGMGGTAYVNFTGSAFGSVTASSSSNSFEFDNVAFGTVPEPSSMALCGIAGSLGMVVRARRRRAAV